MIPVPVLVRDIARAAQEESGFVEALGGRVVGQQAEAARCRCSAFTVPLSARERPCLTCYLIDRVDCIP
jgi:hypothetical protein